MLRGGLVKGGTRHRVLIAEDEPGIRLGIKDFLEAKGYEVEEAETCEATEALFRTSRPDLAVLDYLLTDGNTLDLLPRLKVIDPLTPILFLTGHGTIDLAVRAVKQGADQFFTKPVELPTLLVVIERLLDSERSRKKDLAVRSRQSRMSIDPFVGTSDAIRRVAQEAARVAASESPVLVRGETGTGKGVLARWLHRNGPRAEESFVDMNCAGLSRDLLETELFGHERGAFTGASTAKTGLLEVAHRGTVFLDEIGDMDVEVQAKLLKVLEEKQFRRLGETRDRRVDIRLVAATHQDLAERVRQKKFRSDLFFRVNTIPLTMPALRERAEDIAELAEVLLLRLAPEMGRSEARLSREAVRALERHSWPGNIRELRNVIERALLLTDGPQIEASSLRFDTGLQAESTSSDSSLTLLEVERRHIARVLQEEGGRVEQAALRLGVPRSSLYQKIKRHGIVASRI
jgi:DNA-binding NtrC family response regulator